MAVLCFFSPPLFAGDARVAARKAGGGQIQIAKDANGITADPPAADAKSAFVKKKQELKAILDQIATLGRCASIDWGDGTPPPSLTVTIDWGDGVPPSSLTVTSVVARVRPGAGVALNAPVPGAAHEAGKYLDQTTPNLTAQAAVAPVAGQGDIRRPQQPGPDEIQRANKLVAEYNAKRDAYALEKPNGSYFAALPRLEAEPIELKTKAAAGGGEGVGSGKYAVLVYKSEGGQWAKQPERTLNTDDAQAATDYAVQVNAVQGWMATTNVPEDVTLRKKLPGKMQSGQLFGKGKSGNK